MSSGQAAIQTVVTWVNQNLHNMNQLIDITMLLTMNTNECLFTIYYTAGINAYRPVYSDKTKLGFHIHRSAGSWKSIEAEVSMLVQEKVASKSFFKVCSRCSNNVKGSDGVTSIFYFINPPA